MRLTPAERAEVARLFQLRLASLREQPPRRAARRLHRQPPKVALPLDQPPDDALLSSGEVAGLLGVTAHTIRRWALPCMHTLGGQRRFRWREVWDWLS